MKEMSENITKEELMEICVELKDKVIELLKKAIILSKKIESYEHIEISYIS